MRKITVLAAIMTLTAAMAIAYPGGGFGGTGAPCGGPGFGGGAGFGGAGAPCGGPGCGSQDFEPVDEAGANEKVQEFLDTNLKGFEIESSEAFKMPRGTMYKYIVKDSNSNEFGLMVNPFGYVRGPIPLSYFK